MNPTRLPASYGPFAAVPRSVRVFRCIVQFDDTASHVPSQKFKINISSIAGCSATRNALIAYQYDDQWSSPESLEPSVSTCGNFERDLIRPQLLPKLDSLVHELFVPIPKVSAHRRFSISQSHTNAASARLTASAHPPGRPY
jgi:hypothetical protein